ncbi:hypothetical protein GPJ61_25625 [Brevibacillus formosus]|uniref:hypothetical protein n=1 Tax=Brevibacillus formosus TaxID=54913 RepID=UPI001CA55D88|nr:hypothetical protein [Brevibacillus formosus]MBW5471178.1 hypothetical protein [Brevibacillus formosus]
MGFSIERVRESVSRVKERAERTVREATEKVKEKAIEKGKEIFPNDPKAVGKIVAEKTATGMAMGAAFGVTVGGMGQAKDAKYKGTAGAVVGGHLGAIRGTIEGNVRHEIGKALWAKGD